MVHPFGVRLAIDCRMPFQRIESYCCFCCPCAWLVFPRNQKDCSLVVQRSRYGLCTLGRLERETVLGWSKHTHRMLAHTKTSIHDAGTVHTPHATTTEASTDEMTTPLCSSSNETGQSKRTISRTQTNCVNYIVVTSQLLVTHDVVVVFRSLACV